MDVEKTIRQYLPQIVHMSLATCADNKPWVCEVHFAYDEQLNLYFRSLTTRRHSQEIAANPNVAGNMVTQHFLGQAVRAVYFEGTAVQVIDDSEREKAFEVMSRRLHFGNEILDEAKRDDGHQFYKISVDTYYLFDSYSSHPSQKYELQWNGGNR